MLIVLTKQQPAHFRRSLICLFSLIPIQLLTIRILKQTDHIDLSFERHVTQACSQLKHVYSGNLENSRKRMHC